MTVLVFRDGATRKVEAVDPAWLRDDAAEVVWVDIQGPGEADKQLLSNTFHFHELAVEDAMAEAHHPKIELYDHVLYLILHGIVARPTDKGFETHDIDFFLGRNYLVTVHHYMSRSIAEEQGVVLRHGTRLGEGPCSLLHHI